MLKLKWFIRHWCRYFSDGLSKQAVLSPIASDPRMALAVARESSAHGNGTA